MKHCVDYGSLDPSPQHTSDHQQHQQHQDCGHERSTEYSDITRLRSAALSYTDESSASPRAQTILNVAIDILEWYAFAIFGYLSDVLSDVFFASTTNLSSSGNNNNNNNNTALLESFVVFGGAFLMRPLGGIWMGYLGDVHGRKRALEVSVLLMAAATLLMASLPTNIRHQEYADHREDATDDETTTAVIDVPDELNAYMFYSTLGLVLTRLLQGLSAGGQLMSSLVYAVEGTPQEHWGLRGSYVMAAANLGNWMAGVSVYLLRRYLTSYQLHAWGWRIPNVASGLLLLLCGWFLKDRLVSGGSNCRHVDSSEPLDTSKKNDTSHAAATIAPNPFRIAMSRENRRPLLAACMVPILWSAGFWLCFVWMPIYMLDLLPHPISGAFGINSWAVLVSVCAFFPLAGHWSDQWGRHRVMTIGGIGFGILAPLLLWGLSSSYTTAWTAFVSQVVMGMCLSLWGAPMMAWLVESFDPQARLTSAAVGYNLGVGVFAGMAPAAATWLVEDYGYRAPSGLLAALGVIGLTGLWVVAPAPPSREAMM